MFREFVYFFNGKMARYLHEVLNNNDTDVLFGAELSGYVIHMTKKATQQKRRLGQSLRRGKEKR